MKKIHIALFLIFSSLLSYSQNVGIGTTTPHTSAALEIKDSTKGFLMPRLNTLQRDSIANPAEGLQIYNTSNYRPEIYSQGKWEAVNFINQYYNIENSNDQEGYIQTGILDCACRHQGGTIKVIDFEIDSTNGDGYYLVQYQGRKYFMGQELPCIDSNYTANRLAIIKADSSQHILWKQIFTYNLPGAIALLTDGNLAVMINVSDTSTAASTINIGGNSLSKVFGSYVVKISPAGNYLSHKWIAGATIQSFAVNQLNTIGLIYSTTTALGYTAELIDGSSPTLARIWLKSSTTLVYSQFGIYPNENSLLVYTGTNLQKITASNIQTLAALGTTGNIYYPADTTPALKQSIIITNSNFQITIPSMNTLNNISYNSMVHVIISRANNAIQKITELSKFNMKIYPSAEIFNVVCNDKIIELSAVKLNSPSQNQTDIYVNVLDMNGNRLFFDYQSMNGTNGANIYAIRTKGNKVIISGSYTSDLVGSGFLSFIFAPTGSTSAQYFLYNLLVQ